MLNISSRAILPAPGWTVVPREPESEAAPIIIPMTARSAAPRSGAIAALWRQADFRKLWLGHSVSELGSQISFVAIPVTAVTVLGAGPFETGLLGALQFLPFLVLGLPAGVWVDRVARRPILILADLGRAVALVTVPLAWTLGMLRLPQLYAVGLVVGGLTVFFDIAQQSYVPSLVEPDQLVHGNSYLALSESVAEVAGPGLGGLLIGLTSAPAAILADAASFLLSAAGLLLIRTPDVVVRRAGGTTLLRRELGEGLTYVLRHPLLRPIAICSSLTNLFSRAAGALVVVFAVRELGLGAGGIGLCFSLGSLGGPAGAAVAARVGRRYGPGPTIVAAAWTACPSWLLLALAPRSQAILFMVAAGILGSFAGVIYNVTQITLRQTITPRSLRARMTATMRFMVWGTVPLGALGGGVLGAHLGLRPTLVVAACCQLLAALPVTLSGVRGLRLVAAEPRG